VILFLHQFLLQPPLPLLQLVLVMLQQHTEKGAVKSMTQTQIKFKQKCINASKVFRLHFSSNCYFTCGRDGWKVLRWAWPHVFMSASISKHQMYKLHHILCTRCLWPLLGHLWWQCSTLCNSELENAVMLSNNGSVNKEYTQSDWIGHCTRGKGAKSDVYVWIVFDNQQNKLTLPLFIYNFIVLDLV